MEYALSWIKISTACKIHGMKKNKDKLNQASPRRTAGGGGSQDESKRGELMPAVSPVKSEREERMISGLSSITGKCVLELNI